ncbi:FtsX-like permease family protein [Nonomuraea sp. NPDC050547]|uniref:FtsX-like permease family protein n=1 Tax=Nonomuraea sp. NPDC050547 TaxID=3364368 RepID=UPI0037A862D5
MIRTALAMSGLGGLVVAFFAVFGGMALITGTGVIIESGLRSNISGQRLVHADVLVSAPQSLAQEGDLPVALPERAVLPATLAGELARLDGVASATGDVSFPATPLGDLKGDATPPDDGRSDAKSDVKGGAKKEVEGGAASAGQAVAGTGHGWDSAALAGGKLISGRAPRAGDEIVVPKALAVRQGASIEVVAGGRRGEYRVTGVMDGPDLYFADRTAAELAGRTSGPRAGTVDLIALRAAPGTDPANLAEAVHRKVGERYEVRTGPDKGDAESPGTAAARGMLIALPSSISGISMLIVGFVVGGGISLSITRQRRDLALLRAAGATPRQVRKLVAVQGMTAALAALLPGAAAGYYLAAHFGDLLIHLGLLPPELPLTYSPIPAAAAALVLLGVVRVSAWAVSISASKMPAVAAVRDAQSEPRRPSAVRFNSGLLIILAAMGLSTMPLFLRGEVAVLGPSMGGLLSVIGLALAGPRLVQKATGLLVRVLPARVSPPLWLAVSNTHGYALRTAGAVAALGMVITLGTSNALTHTTVMRATADETARTLRADAVITAPAYGGIPRDLLGEVRAVPGVSSAVTASTTTVIGRGLALGDGAESAMARSAMVLGPEARGLVDLGVTKGGLADLKGPSIAIDERSGSVGEHRDLVLGDGAKVRARVVATYSRALGLGPIVLARDLVAGHTTTDLDSTVFVRTADPSALNKLSERWPALSVASAATSPQAGETSAQLWINIAVLAVLLGYVLVSVANRLVATTAARGAELTAIRRLGATPGQIRSMIRWEALLIALTASVAGLLMSAVPLMFLSIGFLGRPWPAGPLWLAPAAVAVVCAVVGLAYDLPARRLVRRSERVA